MISGLSFLMYAAAFYIILHTFSKLLPVKVWLYTVSCLSLAKVSCARSFVIVMDKVQSKLSSGDAKFVFPVKELVCTVRRSAGFR